MIFSDYIHRICIVLIFHSLACPNFGSCIRIFRIENNKKRPSGKRRIAAIWMLQALLLYGALLYVHDFRCRLVLRTLSSGMAAPAQQQSKDRTAKRNEHHNVERVREALRQHGLLGQQECFL